MVIRVLQDIRLGIGFAFLAYIVVWILAIVIMVLLAAILVISRKSPDAVRDVFRQFVASSSSEELVHVTDRSGSSKVAAALRNLRTFDPEFDMTVFLDSARVAVGAYAMAQMGRDDRLLRRITTPGFWQTFNGKMINQLMINRDEQARKHPDRPKSPSVILDVSWRQPVVQEVALGQRGVDRITVRLASVFIGARMPGWCRVDSATELDWDFVRPAGAATDPGPCCNDAPALNAAAPTGLRWTPSARTATRPAPTRRPAGGWTATTSSCKQGTEKRRPGRVRPGG